MRILIVSQTSWDISNSFGNTFSNLFSGMEDIEIYHICCKHGATNGSPAQKTFQMTDRAVMRSILCRNGGVGWLVGKSIDNRNNAAVSVAAEKKRHPLAYYVRDMIWTLGAWKHDATLQAFLAEVKPDVLYLPIYSSCYMCDVQQYIANICSVPIVGHITDDVFAVSPDASLPVRHYARKVGKKLRRLIARCAYLEVFAENMQRQYAADFHKPVYLIGKGVDINAIPEKPAFTDRSDKHFVYTGNIGGERWRTLVMIGKALCGDGGQGVLDIYSATMLTTEMEEAFNNCGSICFHGSVPADAIPAIQANADVLVHVEGFTPAAIAATQMSFSTKLIDYMMAGKPIFAVGDGKINSIAVLKKYGLAVVAELPGQIETRVKALLSGDIDVEGLFDNTVKYLETFRDIRKIQEGMRSRLFALRDRLKVLQVNAVNGILSTGRSCSEIADYLNRRGDACYTAYSIGQDSCNSFCISSAWECKCHALLSRVTGLQGYFSHISTAKLLCLIRDIKPDVVQLRNLHANYLHLNKLLHYLASHDIATVVTLHDCWVYTGKCTHYTSIGCNKWQTGCYACPKLKTDNVSWFFDRTPKMWQDKKNGWRSIPRLAVIGVSDWITGEAKKSPMFVNASVIRRIYNWIDLDVFCPMDSALTKEKLGLSDKKIILGVASGWNNKKGLDRFIELAELLKEDERIVLVGNMPQVSLPDYVISVPATADVNELAAYYNAADVFLQLSPEETFGKVVAEALACGTPVVTNAGTANPELVNASCGEVLLANADVSDILAAVRRFLRVGKDCYSSRCRERVEMLFNKDENMAQYRSVYSALTERNKN